LHYFGDFRKSKLVNFILFKVYWLVSIRLRNGEIIKSLPQTEINNLGWVVTDMQAQPSEIISVNCERIEEVLVNTTTNFYDYLKLLELDKD